MSQTTSRSNERTKMNIDEHDEFAGFKSDLELVKRFFRFLFGR